MRVIFGWIGILGGAIPIVAQGVPASTVVESIVVTASLEEEAAEEQAEAVDPEVLV